MGKRYWHEYRLRKDRLLQLATYLQSVSSILADGDHAYRRPTKCSIARGNVQFPCLMVQWQNIEVPRAMFISLPAHVVVNSLNKP